MEELLGALVQWIKYGAIGVLVIAGIFVIKQWQSMEQASTGDTPQTTVGSVGGADVTRAAYDCGCNVKEVPPPPLPVERPSVEVVVEAPQPRPAELPPVEVVVEAPPPIEQSEARQSNDSQAQEPVFSVNTPPVIGDTMEPGPQMFAAVSGGQQVVFGYDITVHPKKHRWPRRFFGAIAHGIRKAVTLGH